jgi:DNA-binding transcriptional LysR family regulator
MSIEFKIAQLKHFILVAELKGFQAAAEKAHRSQPAISLSIKDLEQKLGEPLFEKTINTGRTARAELTPFGQYLLPRAKELVDKHDLLAQDVRLLTNHKKGHLRLASIPSIARQFLPELLKEFAHQTSLQVSIFDDQSSTVIKMVEQQQVDFGITSIKDENELIGFDFIPIWNDSVGIVCHVDHPLTEYNVVHPVQLKEYNYISNGTTALLTDELKEFLLENTQYHISNMISLLAILETGLGVTTLPKYAFPNNYTNLVFRPFSSPKIHRKIGIVSLQGKSLTPAAKAFIDLVIQRYT